MLWWEDIRSSCDDCDYIDIYYVEIAFFVLYECSDWLKVDKEDVSTFIYFLLLLMMLQVYLNIIK